MEKNFLIRNIATCPDLLMSIVINDDNQDGDDGDDKSIWILENFMLLLLQGENSKEKKTQKN